MTLRWKSLLVGCGAALLLPFLVFAGSGDYTPARDGITMTSHPAGSGQNAEFNRYTDDTFYAQLKRQIPMGFNAQEAFVYAQQRGITSHLDQRDFLSVRRISQNTTEDNLLKYEHGLSALEPGDRVQVMLYMHNNATGTCGGANEPSSVVAKIDLSQRGKVRGEIQSQGATPEVLNDLVDTGFLGDYSLRFVSADLFRRTNPSASCSGGDMSFTRFSAPASVSGDIVSIDITTADGSIPGGNTFFKAALFELEVVDQNVRPLRVARTTNFSRNAVLEGPTTLHYTVEVSNVSGNDIENVVVTDTLPAGVTFVSGSAGFVSAENNQVRLAFGTVGNSPQTLGYTVNIADTVPNDTTLCVQGQATADGVNGTITENCPYCVTHTDLDTSYRVINVCANGLAERELFHNEECDDGNLDPGDGCDQICRGLATVADAQKEAQPTAFNSVARRPNATSQDPLSFIEYELTVRNPLQRDMTNVVIHDTLNSNLEYIPVADDGVTANGQSLTINVGTLAPQQSQGYVVRVQVRENAPNGGIDNQFFVTGQTVDATGNPVDIDTPSNVIKHFVVPNPDPVCGNYRREGPEQCDDGNTVSGDGCSGTEDADAALHCQLENPALCGNGTPNPGEECDDGNNISGDGCNEWCANERDCGNGETETPFEACDDANVLSGDSCTGTESQDETEHCQIASRDLFLQKEADPVAFSTVERGQEIVYQVSVGNNTADPLTNVTIEDTLESNLTFLATVLEPNAGDIDATNLPIIGIMVGTVAPGNVPPTRPFPYQFRVEINDTTPLNSTVSNFVTGTATASGGAVQGTSRTIHHFVVESAPRVCGNFRREAGEQCDDGNTVSGDGCSGTENADVTTHCQFEDVTTCGNGDDTDPGEECDDGNRESGDGCTEFCQNEHDCGNGQEENPPETCDDGNTVSGDGCSGTESQNVATHCQDETTGTPNLRLEKRAMPGTGTVVDPTAPENAITYTITAVNNGPSDLENIVVTDNLDAGLIYISGDNGVTHQNGVVTLTFGNVPFGGTPPELSFVVNISPGITVPAVVNNAATGTGTVVGSGSTANATSNTTTHFVIADATPECGNDRTEPGEQCDDNNTVSGDGCSGTEDPDPANHCQLEHPELCGNGDDTDPGEECDDGNTIPGDGCNEYCQNESPICGNHQEENPPETCDDGNVVSGDGCSGTESNDPAQYCQDEGGQTGPELDIVKSASPAGGETVTPNTHITYTIQVSNNTGEGVQNIELSDQLDGDVTHNPSVSPQVPAGGTFAINGQSVVLTLNSLADGASETFSFAVVVNGNPPSGSVDNTVNVTGGQTVGGENVTGTSNTVSHPLNNPNRPPGGNNPRGGGAPLVPSIGTCSYDLNTRGLSCIERHPHRWTDPEGYQTYWNCTQSNSATFCLDRKTEVGAQFYAECLLTGREQSECQTLRIAEEASAYNLCTNAGTEGECLLQWAESRDLVLCGPNPYDPTSALPELPNRSDLINWGSNQPGRLSAQCQFDIPGPACGATPHCPSCFADAKIQKSIAAVNGTFDLGGTARKEARIAKGDTVTFRLQLTLQPRGLNGKQVQYGKVNFYDVTDVFDSAALSSIDQNDINSFLWFRNGIVSGVVPGTNIGLEYDPKSYQLNAIGQPFTFELTSEHLQDLNNERPVTVDIEYDMNSSLAFDQDLWRIENTAFATVEYVYRVPTATGFDIENDKVRIDATGATQHCGNVDYWNDIATFGDSAAVELVRPFIQAKAGGDIGLGENTTGKVTGSGSELTDKTSQNIRNTSGGIYVGDGLDDKYVLDPSKAIKRSGGDLTGVVREFAGSDIDQYIASLKHNTIPVQLWGKDFKRTLDQAIYIQESGDLTLPTAASNTLDAFGGSTIIVENGDLLIEDDLEIENGFIAFIVLNGDVIISEDVTRVEGVYINFSAGSGLGFTGDGQKSREQLEVSGAFVGNLQKLLDARLYIGSDPQSRLEPNVKFLFDLRMVEETPPGLEQFLGENWKQAAK